MKFFSKKFLFHLVVLSLCFNACASNHAGSDNSGTDSTLIKTVSTTDTLLPGTVNTKVYCTSDASQSYALYMPATKDANTLPVIFFFDPHGDGSLPITKYKGLADSFHFILAGSNNSKNGNDWPTAENIWNTLFSDIKNRLQHNSYLIYVCGFSGGAKVATYLALHHNEVKGVIANGAGLPDITAAGNFAFSYTSIAGEGDLNMTDIVSINNSLEKTKTNHRIIFFDGIHEWAPESTMSIAFAGFKLDAMRDNSLPKDVDLIAKYITSAKKLIDIFIQKNNYIHAQRGCALSINMLAGLTNDVAWFNEKNNAIKNNKIYQQQLQAQRNIFAKEENIKEVYQQQFQQGDKNYWIKTINDVIAKGKLHNSESAMYQRLHAFLSLAFYSITNQLVNANQNIEAAYFDELYKLSDPLNTEAWYFSALLHARNNNAADVKNDLTKAISLGFTDKDRILKQQEFQNIASQINLPDIISSINK